MGDKSYENDDMPEDGDAAECKYWMPLFARREAGEVVDYHPPAANPSHHFLWHVLGEH